LTDSKYYARSRFTKKTTKLFKLNDIDRNLSMILANFHFLKYITPLNASYWKNLYIQGEPLRIKPDFVYREANIDFQNLHKKLSIIIPEDDISVLLARKANELKLFLELIKARNSPVFLEISKQIYGSSDEELLKHAKNWLKLTSGNPSTFHFNSKVLKEKLEEEIQKMNIDVKVKLRKFLSSKAAAGVNTIGLKANAMFSHEDFVRILAHEVETHILRTLNGMNQNLKSVFYYGFPRAASQTGGYLKTEEGLALFQEERSGILSAKRKRIIAARVLSIYLMDRENLDFNEIFDILTREHKFSASIAFEICERTFRAGGFTKDQIYLKGYLQE